MNREIIKYLAVIGLSLAAPSLVIAATPVSPPSVSTKHKALWINGRKMEARGVAKLAKAQAKLVRVDADVIKVNSKLAAGVGESAGAAARFVGIALSQPNSLSSFEATAYAKQVTDAAKIWADIDKKNKVGFKDLDRATRAKTTAEAEINAAQSEIDQGRHMMEKAVVR